MKEMNDYEQWKDSFERWTRDPLGAYSDNGDVEIIPFVKGNEPLPAFFIAIHPDYYLGDGTLHPTVQMGLMLVLKEHGVNMKEILNDLTVKGFDDLRKEGADYDIYSK